MSYVLLITFLFLSFIFLLLMTIILPRLTRDHKFKPIIIFAISYIINYTVIHFIFGVATFSCLLFILVLIFLSQVFARKMRVIGLTGQICSGKSTVSEYFEKKYNCRVINIDMINRQVLSRIDVLNEIRNHFGSEVFDNKGELNKIMLRKIIFSDPLKKLKLEKITHRRVLLQLFFEIVSHKIYNCSKILIIENAILLKLPIFKLFFYPIIGVCTLNKDILIKRIMHRDSITEEVAENILKNQLTAQDFMNQCDYCIINDKDTKHLEEQVDKFISIIGRKI